AIDETVSFIDDNFEGANIGLIYNSGEANSVAQIDQVNEAAEGTSLSTSERTVSNSAEVQQAADTLSGDVDVFYIVKDNTVVSSVATVVDYTDTTSFPLLVINTDSFDYVEF